MKRKPRSPSPQRRLQPRPVIFGTGLVALDLVISATPGTPIRAWAGGTCGNVLTILSYLGWDAYPIARLNDAPAAQRLKSDLRRWGVHLDYAGCEPATDAPIIVQEIRRTKNGEPTHRFRWVWPHCGHWLPGYRSVTLKATAHVQEHVNRSTVFFLDRLSPAALKLAETAADMGALVFFEPSTRTEPRLLAAALALAHVIKYADQRIELPRSTRPSASVMLEIKTMGTRGLMYRSWLPQVKNRGWQHVPSVPAPALADACGAGDWCTAGIISKIGLHGANGFSTVTAPALRACLRYGQALAAWNCGFEGARGGMYAVDHTTFEKQIIDILAGGAAAVASDVSTGEEIPPSIRCPACSPAS